MAYIHVPDKNRVLILEPSAAGHHGPYLHWMATGMADRGLDVTIVTRAESQTHPSIRTLVDHAVGNGGKAIRVVSVAGPALQNRSGQRATDLVAHELAYWRLFRDWYKAHADTVRPDVIFLPYLDYCLHAIGLLGSPFGKCPWVGLAMRPSFHLRKMGVIAPQPSLASIKKALFFRLLDNRYLRRLLTIDESLAEYLKGKTKGVGRTAFLPEPAELGNLPNTADAKRQLGVPMGRKLVLVYGAISRRKGVVELMRALANPAFPASVDVLLAGEVLDDVHDLLAESSVRSLLAQGRLRLLDRFIITEEEPVLFAAADIVWLGYRGHYTASGVLVQAASAGCPVIACEEGILGWQARRHGLGVVLRPADASAIIVAVNSLLEGAPRTSGSKSYAKPALGGSFAAAQDILVRAMVGSTVSAHDIDASRDT
jgi:glycosyltransferase involved in cell wall biosynthesis